MLGRDFGARIRGPSPPLENPRLGAMLHLIKGAGHCPHIDRPGEFNEEGLRFLNA